MHEERLNVGKVDPKAYRAVLAGERYVRGSSLEGSLVELVKIRVSQINHCAFCLDMHLRDAREMGEDQRRLDVLAAWWEAPSLYTPREQAALALSEVVTLISQEGVPEKVWQDAAEQFSEQQLVELLMAINVINVWNRLAVATHQALPDISAP